MLMSLPWGLIKCLMTYKSMRCTRWTMPLGRASKTHILTARLLNAFMLVMGTLMVLIIGLAKNVTTISHISQGP